MSFFDTEYLTNGYIYGHSYYRRRIGNMGGAGFLDLGESNFAGGLRHGSPAAGSRGRAEET